MRIVIDFLHARDGIEPAALNLAKALAAAAGTRELWIAAPLGQPGLLEDLRLAFPGRVRALDLTGNARLQPAPREHALARLSPAVGLVPRAADSSLPPLPFPALSLSPLQNRRGRRPYAW